MADQGEERGFKVVDRRSFDRDGADRKAEEAPADDSGPQGPAGEAQPNDEACGDPAAFANEPLPELDFVTFILSLHNSAACLLGHAPYPDTGQCAANLPMAKQTIDIIGMLQEKTKGNLSGEEERIVSEVLYDLRMAYVQAVRK